MYTRKELKDFALNAMMGQYEEATRLRSVITNLVDVLADEMLDAITELSGWPDPDECSGYVLDGVGGFLGLERPLVSSGSWFGFSGATGYTAGGFGTPMADDNALRNAKVPIADTTYRSLIKGRALALRGGCDRETTNKILQVMGSEGYVKSSAQWTWTLNIKTDNNELWSVLSGQTSYSAQIVPQPTGYTVSWNRLT